MDKPMLLRYNWNAVCQNAQEDERVQFASLLLNPAKILEILAGNWLLPLYQEQNQEHYR
jgi:hypothetical protein